MYIAFFYEKKVSMFTLSILSTFPLLFLTIFKTLKSMNLLLSKLFFYGKMYV